MSVRWRACVASGQAYDRWSGLWHFQQSLGPVGFLGSNFTVAWCRGGGPDQTDDLTNDPVGSGLTLVDAGRLGTGL
jgi:hypothetical protein